MPNKSSDNPGKERRASQVSIKNVSKQKINRDIKIEGDSEILNQQDKSQDALLIHNRDLS